MIMKGLNSIGDQLSEEERMNILTDLEYIASNSRQKEEVKEEAKNEVKESEEFEINPLEKKEEKKTEDDL